ncbi:uncharacterized protein LOC126846123 [Adelges cooleyi]|uniref:uncharacterized protein LOC126846123 n=1 Tax=Adelges cooleyi TaxID=133065 RepID=UPI00217FCF62|nr:uncharacterized protein LOC126846123 [Adelges cooleyi]
MKMTNNKLQVLYLFVFTTICIVINYIECVPREACRKQIFKTNHMISLLDDDQKYDLIEYLLRVFKYDGMAEFLYPPDSRFMTGRRARDLALMYHRIYRNERAIQLKLVQILDNLMRDLDDGQKYQLIEGLIKENNYGAEQTVHFGERGSWKSEVKERRNILNKAYNDFLDETLKGYRMCENDDGKKCILVGLIKRTLNYQLTNEAECNGGSCIITSTEWITEPGVLSRIPPVIETYQDKYFPNVQRHVTLFLRKQGELVYWDSETQDDSGEDPSDQE